MLLLEPAIWTGKLAHCNSILSIVLELSCWEGEFAVASAGLASRALPRFAPRSFWLVAMVDRLGVSDGGSLGRAGLITRKYNITVTTPNAAKVASNSRDPS